MVPRRYSRRYFHGTLHGTFVCTLDGTFNGTLDGTLDGTLGSTLEGTLRGSLDGTVDGVLDGTRLVLRRVDSPKLLRREGWKAEGWVVVGVRWAERGQQHMSRMPDVRCARPQGDARWHMLMLIPRGRLDAGIRARVALASP